MAIRWLTIIVGLLFANAALAQRVRDVEQARAAGEATVPTTIGMELATNPFMRVSSAEELAERRQNKDVFRG